MRRRVARFCLPTLLSVAAFGQSPAPAAAFETAEVRASKPDAAHGFSLRSGVFEAIGMPLRDLIAMAYGVKDSMVAGGEKWLETDRFDVIAKAAPTASFTAVRAMLGTLLAKSFNLAVHKEDQPVRVYALTVAGRNPKLTESHGSAPSRCELGRASTLQRSLAMGHEYITVMNYTYTCQNTTMAQLAERLPSAASKDLDHPVVDLTGLKGAYDFVLSWSVPAHVDSLPDTAPPDWRAGQAAPGPRPSQSGGLTVFEGVGKLGLKLVAQKQSAPVLVIDHVDRIPAH